MEAISRDLGEQKNKTPILRDNGGGPAMQTPVGLTEPPNN